MDAVLDYLALTASERKAIRLDLTGLQVRLSR